MQDEDMQALLQEVRELRSSIDVLNGLLKMIFQNASTFPAPETEKRKSKRVKSKPPAATKPADGAPPKPGRHF